MVIAWLLNVGMSTKEVHGALLYPPVGIAMKAYD